MDVWLQRTFLLEQPKYGLQKNKKQNETSVRPNKNNQGTSTELRFHQGWPSQEEVTSLQEQPV